jgi:hypothetical protein
LSGDQGIEDVNLGGLEVEVMLDSVKSTAIVASPVLEVISIMLTIFIGVIIPYENQALISVAWDQSGIPLLLA